MATVKANRTLQYTLVGEFVINVAADAMLNTSVPPVLTAFKAMSSWDVIALPPNAVVVNGDVTVETASNDSGVSHTIAVGDVNNASRYLAATSLKATGRTALTLTGYRGVGENIRVTTASGNGDATTGKVSLRVHYTVTGRANETQIT